MPHEQTIHDAVVKVCPEEEEYVECECPNCGREMKQPKWLLDKYKKEGDNVYCSEGCRYNRETGNPGEEY